MFPFHRKHGNSSNASKQSGGKRQSLKEEEEEMSDDEYSQYIRQHDNSRHQLTSLAHDKYCDKIIREKEEVLLSSLTINESAAPSNEVRLGPGNNIFKCLLNKNRPRESVSMPSSPVNNKNYLSCANESSTRRKSAIISSGKDSPHDPDEEYILTLKVEDQASDTEDISFYRIGKYVDSCQDPDKCFLSDDSSDSYDSDSGSSSSDLKFGISHYSTVDEETSVALKQLLTASPDGRISGHWLRQCFSFCHIHESRWRLVQMKAGCCGVIAAVEAYLIKSLIFTPGMCRFKEPLRPNSKEVFHSFVNALAYILWQAGDFSKAVLIDPQTRSSSSGNTTDGVTDTFIYYEFFDYQTLLEAVSSRLRVFTSPPHHGYLNFVISVILSRGIEKVRADMDVMNNSLITQNGSCSMELVMLLLTGSAISNVFDFDKTVDSCLLKGVKKKSNIGFLSFFEHLNTCEVGHFLKTPKYPIWLVNYTDHFTVLFSNKKEHVVDDVKQPFVLYHYDSLTAFQCETDIKLAIDPLGNYTDDQLNGQTHLQYCIRTKWKNAIVIYTENSELYLV